MAEQERISLNIQLPVGALEGFSRLAEQLRGLAAELKGGGSRPALRLQTEEAENTSFDFSRFQALGGTPETPRQVKAAVSGPEDPETLQGQAQSFVRRPDSAGADIGRTSEFPTVSPQQPFSGWEPPPETAPHTADAAYERADSPAAQTTFASGGAEAEVLRTEEAHSAELSSVPAEEEKPVLKAEAVQGEAVSPISEAKAVQAPAESAIAEAVGLRMEPERQIPAAERLWTDWPRPLSAPPPLQTEASYAPESPPAASIVPTDGPELPRSRWSAAPEEPAAAEGAPLTAEAVSQAFRRDGRRYDGGFPLY